MEIHFSCKTNHRLTNSNDMYPRWFQRLGYIYAILIPKQLHGLGIPLKRNRLPN